MSGAIAIFAKTPGLTPAKTRLAKVIGRDRAEAFHRLALDVVEECVTAFLASRPGWRACWAVAEAEGVELSRWRALGAQHTGDGGLGERMARVYEALRREHGAALLIGADAPELQPAHLEEAADALETSPLLLGPAKDGGFWLVGGRIAIPPAAWRTPRYGTKFAREDFEAALRNAGLPAPRHLVSLQDIDEVGDLEGLAARLGDGPPAKAALAKWLLSESLLG